MRFSVVNYCREKHPTFYTRLADKLDGIKRPRPVGRFPVPQTSPSTSSSFRPLDRTLFNLFDPIFAVFQLPDELILHLLSHISPEPQLTGHYARFRFQYGMAINDYHEQRVGFLRPLSMTCVAMRLRLLPWIWERLELIPSYSPEFLFQLKVDAAAKTLRKDISLAASVKYFYSFCP